LKLVSSNTDAEIACQRAKGDVDSALCELTANLLRVTRGAGKAYEIRRQAIELVTAMQAHWDACGMWPSADELTAAVSLKDQWRGEGSSDQEGERLNAIRHMVGGSLQMAASSLLDQRTQFAAGETELFAGVREIERMREEKRREYRRGVKVQTVGGKPRRRAAGKPKKPAG
jgi:hypothetical protein